MANKLTLTIGTSSIREQDGLFSLNDLHQAAGGEAKHQPAFFMRSETAKALVSELNASSANSQSIKTITGKGKEQGTYACRELVVAYAAWISAAFHLKVIRVFLGQAAPAQATDGLSPARALTLAATTLTPAEQRTLQEAVNDCHHRTGMTHGRIWHRVKETYRVPRYEQMLRTDLDACLHWLRGGPRPEPKAPPHGWILPANPDSTHLCKDDWLSLTQEQQQRIDIHCATITHQVHMAAQDHIENILAGQAVGSYVTDEQVASTLAGVNLQAVISGPHAQALRRITAVLHMAEHAYATSLAQVRQQMSDLAQAFGSEPGISAAASPTPSH